MPTIRSPKGTRDFYPDALLLRRFISEAWRRTALLHGFDEIDGPTFEHLDLYTVKSGEGIVSELFSFQRSGGDETYALRPEFTPTLARMYAAKARELPVPTRWFCTPAFFRAERPQRGRLREFLQWNVDIIGDDSPNADAEVIACAVDLFRTLGLDSSRLAVRMSNRDIVTDILTRLGIDADRMDAALALLDKKAKLDEDTFRDQCAGIGLDAGAFADALTAAEERITSGAAAESEHEQRLLDTVDALRRMGLESWVRIDLSIVRGLAYYTGAVFEIIAGNERAVAGGGRYDKLIELFGGPPTPAIGFGMGDVVLSLVLDDDGLLPSGAALLDHLSQPMPTRPDVFVVPAGNDEAESALLETVAALREAGLHTRRTYKATRKIGKLLKDASDCHARYAVIVESATHATVKNLESGEQHADVPLAEISSRCGASASAP